MVLYYDKNKGIILKTCAICKATLDNNWINLQNMAKNGINAGSLLNKAFDERCIYCYKRFLELLESKEHEWYLQVIKIWEMRNRW
jgi:hypothetical protein